MEELEETKKKAIEKYKLFEDFLDNIVEELISIFHKGFKDYLGKVRKLFLIIDIALLTQVFLI